MSEQPKDQPTEATPQSPPQPEPQPTGFWSAPQNRATEPADIAKRLGDAGARPMKPLGSISPDADLAGLLGKMMAPPEGDMVQMESQTGVEWGSPPTTYPMMMRPHTYVKQQTLMACPAGYVGMCLACPLIPCAALKAKVLECCSMDYRLQTVAPKP